ncbi:MAG: DNA-binding response OmpR family regulator [Oleiphilaceae bacterium]|jgi:DNA-binding response OmpR family regulator
MTISAFYFYYSLRLEAEKYEIAWIDSAWIDSAESALKLLLEKHIDLIISDLKIEGMDGLALFGRV